jgi:hypothetical protein
VNLSGSDGLVGWEASRPGSDVACPSNEQSQHPPAPSACDIDRHEVLVLPSLTSAKPVNITVPKHYATCAFLSILRAVSMPSV